jgi:hypothetical protein
MQNKFEFFWQKGLAFSEMDMMPYWKFEEYIKMFNKRSKDEAEAQKKQQQQQNQNMPKMPNVPNYSQFKAPSMPSFKR